MNAIESARAAIARSPHEEDLLTLQRLLHALEAEEPFDLERLYALGFDRFELAMGVLRDWRLAQYYSAATRHGQRLAAGRLPGTALS
ncbi:MAG TPA: hypothetical protein VF522_23405 [Ramlibacter sp.]|uniref:hypothetical protein n=1 Tax=Ramlibacter sp. TaxID=1917967 RepID=UPI002ED4A129